MGSLRRGDGSVFSAYTSTFEAKDGTRVSGRREGGHSSGNFRPRGILVATMRGHKSAVNRLAVCQVLIICYGFQMI